MTFNTLSPGLVKGTVELGFEKPTPIQEKVIPFLFDTDRDLVGLAQTGTGKTAAFGLPIIEQTEINVRGVQTLILAPTRELCIQLSKDLQVYSKYMQGLRIVPVYGGANIQTQIKALKNGAHILVATPGRILDLINRKAADLSQVKTVVLDEADEMLNMGFRDELDGILERTPGNKRTLLFSATMPKEVARIANNYMTNPAQIAIGKQNSGADNVRHIYYLVQNRDRYPALKRIVDYHPDIFGLIFCRTKKQTQEVADNLLKDGYNADALHGDLSQAQRDHVMKRFRDRSLNMLVATDVAARGLDVDNISHVINFNLPDDLDGYIHRSGRTGRADKSGVSITIVNNQEKSKITRFENSICKTFEQLPLPTGKDICGKQLFSFINRMEQVDVDDEQIAPFMESLSKKLEWMSKEQIIKQFLSLEFSRLLKYYKHTDDLNSPVAQNTKPELQHNRKATNGKGQKKNQYTRFFINMGKKDDLTPRSLMGMINTHTRKRNIKIGDIQVKNSFAFFEAEAKHTSTILQAFQNNSTKTDRMWVEIAEKPNKPNKKIQHENKGSRTSKKTA